MQFGKVNYGAGDGDPMTRHYFFTKHDKNPFQKTTDEVHIAANLYSFLHV